MAGMAQPRGLVAQAVHIGLALAAYGYQLFVSLYLAAFVTNAAREVHAAWLPPGLLDAWVPRCLDHAGKGVRAPLWAGAPVGAVGMDLLLLLCFGLQHSGMARRRFKRLASVLVPPQLERALYVAVSAGTLHLVIAAWRTVPSVVLWRAPAGFGPVMHGAAWLAFATVGAASFHVSHFEFYGVTQAVGSEDALLHAPPPPVPVVSVGGDAGGTGEGAPSAAGAHPGTRLGTGSSGGRGFVARGLYGVVRHPMMLGMLVGLWCAPVMSMGHLVFAGGLSLYVIVGVLLEEGELVRVYGDTYLDYQARVPMLVPFVGALVAAVLSSEPAATGSGAGRGRRAKRHAD